MPVHSVELGHFILLNVTVQDTGLISRPFALSYRTNFSKVFKTSDFAIINTDGHSDFEIESSLALPDRLERKLDLRLNYMYDFALLLYSYNQLIS
jgi:vacuolar protein sorting-associated protein 13A/C